MMAEGEIRVPEDKCCRPVKAPDFGIVLRVTVNDMQRVGVPVYTSSPTIPGICDLVHVFMGRIRIPDSGKKFSVFPDTNYPQTKVLPASQLFRSELTERET